MRWEYKFVEFGPINTVYHVFRVDDVPFKGAGPETLRAKFCKQLGLEGWEMVSHSYELGDRGPLKSLVVFKRPLPDAQTQPFAWPESRQLG
jgi:hypothetical protein